MFKFLRDIKRRRLLKVPFAQEWESILQQNLTFVSKLEPKEREGFYNHTKVFLLEKAWVAAGTLETVDLEMRVTISGCAARLVRNLPLDIYDRLSEVIVYPVSFALPDDDREILGLANTWGTVVLSWDAVQHGIGRPKDGHDTAIHEFAHILDVSDGMYDGTPPLDSEEEYETWIRVFGRHFANLQKGQTLGVLRSYGAQNEAEFFAVATEAFFERPKRLKRRAPDLYAELSNYYSLDPAAPRKSVE